jgi:ubiquinone/menaquinone biosynthesis C-methylase UbiE
MISGFVLLSKEVFFLECLIFGVVLFIPSLIDYFKRHKLWIKSLDIVQSPYTGESLSVKKEFGRYFLISKTGEKFSIVNGIPVIVKSGYIEGLNKKYNRLYEIIGGFYDDTQRYVCNLRGVKMEHYHHNYLKYLDIKSGDFVLETSVGTGLNFKSLPSNINLFGLDLSMEMLINCQSNLKNWNINAELILGNAEELPFADNVFDTVYHVGGINFFSNRKKAIQEMIRVAKPGSLIMIADETEEYVKKTYEKIPITSRFFKNRKEKVAVPLDLVPGEMIDIHFEYLFKGGFYVITFRKPVI